MEFQEAYWPKQLDILTTPRGGAHTLAARSNRAGGNSARRVGFDKGWADKVAKQTKGRFDFHRGGDKHEPPTAAYVQIYVKSSTLSRAPDLAISGHLTTGTEIDEFVDDALVELEEIRAAAKKALGSPALD